MKLALVCVLFSACAWSQDVSIDIVNAGTPAPLSLPYQFSNTPVGEASSIVLRLLDATANPIEIIDITIADPTKSNTKSANFTVTGMTIDKTLSPGSTSFEDINVNFTPGTQGPISGEITITYELQQNGCTLGGTTASACPSLTMDGGTLQGNATAPLLAVSYQGPGGLTQLQPFSSTPFNFGNVSTSATDPVVFTITNETGAPLTTPAVSLATAVFASSAFALDTSSLPNELPPGGTGTFTVTFAPGQLGLSSATLMVGLLTYPLTGTGAIVGAFDALQIYYVDSQAVRTLPQAATPISFGQVVPGSGTISVLTFTVTNPVVSLDAVPIATLSVSGAGFTMAGSPALPDVLVPGQSLTFTVTFQPSAKGSYAGSLTIGTRVFALQGSSTSSDIPNATLQVDTQPLASQLQAHLSIQLDAASNQNVVGQLTMTFAPSVTNVTDDPAVLFLATNSRQMQVTVADGAQNATYNGQAALSFQTGTTEGTITFTLTFPDTAPVSASFPIAAQKVQIASATAVRQTPYLVVTLNGFDNSYSAGKLSFTFNDLNGNPLTATPIVMDESSAFSQYFFQNNTAGGAFALQAKFPVTGDVSQVGSVTAQLSNSAGTSTVSESFE